MKIFRRIAFVAAVACVCLPAKSQSSTASSQVFQVGVFDGASDDFARGTAHGPVTFVVGQSDPLNDWPAVQLAASATTTSGEAAPRTLQFNLSGPGAAAYRLHIALIIESRGLPAVRIGINGKTGMFYLQSGLAGRVGLFDDTFESLYVPADLTFTFPGAWLHQGTNVITVLPVQQPESNIPGASLNYDAIELDRLPDADAPSAPSAAIDPAVFYKGQPGKLRELVEVYVGSVQPTKAGDHIDLEIAGNHYRHAFSVNEDFGEQKFEFWIPEFKPGTGARLDGRITGKEFHQDATLDPQKKWTLFLVPHIHLDVGFSDYQPKVAAIQVRAMDEAMDFADHHPDYKFSVDGSWDLDQFMKTRTSADQQRAIAAMKKGELYVPAQYADLLTGFPTAETLIRSLYASARFSQLHGTPFNYANITDVPSYSWSYASILAAAGLHDFIAGPNGHETRAPVLLQGRLNESSPFWWVGPDGGKVLFWYARHYWEGGVFFGVPPMAAAGRQTIPVFLKNYERHSYRAHAVILFGTQGENTDLFPEQAQLASAWNQEYAFPKIQYSGFHDALETIATQFGNDLPVVSGDGGPYWEDGIASTARLAAMERRNESRAPSVDKLATLASLTNPRIAADKADLDRMWTNMVLMDEHTWNSHDSVSDPTSEETTRQSAVKQFYALDAQQIADFVARNSMANLAYTIPAGRGSLIVFNTLNWKRSALATFDIQKGREIFDPSTGAVVPVEVVRQSPHLLHVRFMAADVPAFGYKVFELRASKQEPANPEATQSTTIESRYYRLELDPATGAVRSIFDKQLQRELVNQQSPYRFGQYLYVSGGDHRPNTLLQYRAIELQPRLQVDAAHDGRLLSVTRTPYGWVARMKSSDTNTASIATEIRLFDNEKKIEFVEDVDKTAVTSREAVYFAFPFAMDHPQFRYEIQNGVVDPAKNMYPGAGHEWFSVQHWVNVQQDQLAATVMPLDVPLVTLGDIYRGSWPAQFGARPGTIFSFAMNNYWSTNYDGSQGGHVRFRYLVTSAANTDEPALSRMAWEEATPLELNEILTQDKSVAVPSLPASRQLSYLDVTDPDLLVEDWKPAEDGNGTILRLLDLGGATRQVTVRTPLFEIDHAIETNAVERDQSALPMDGPHAFTMTIHAHQIATARIVSNSTH